MAALVKEILVNTRNKTVVKFTHEGNNSSSIGAAQLTGQVGWSDYAFRLNDATGATDSNSRVDITKIFWSITTASTAPTLSITWNLPGSGGLTGQPGFFLSGSGFYDFASNGYTIVNSLVGLSHDNQINIQNINTFAVGCAATVILELDKVSGFGPTG